MVKSKTIQNEDLTTQLEITGRLLARQKIELFAEVTGTMLPNRNRFKEGNYFKKGEALLRIDKEEQTAQPPGAKKCPDEPNYPHAP